MTNFTPLSQQPQGGMVAGIATDPARTTIHIVPEGETHLIKLRVHNVGTSATIRAIGDINGASAQVGAIDQAGITAQHSRTALDEFCAIGPCTITMAAIANASTVNIEGFAQIIRRK